MSLESKKVKSASSIYIVHFLSVYMEKMHVLRKYSYFARYEVSTNVDNERGRIQVIDLLKIS